MTTLGEINEGSEFVIEWSIKDFSSLPAEVDEFHNSPLFSFANESWYLKIYPNGEKEDKSEGYIGLFLFRECLGPPKTMEYFLGVKNLDKNLHEEEYQSHVFESREEGYGFTRLLHRNKLFERKSKFLPSDTLTLVCKVKCPKFTRCESSTNTEAIKCSYCAETSDVHEDIQSHQRKCKDLPIKCRKCDEDVALKNWYDHNCQIAELEDVGDLCHDFKKILLDGNNHDLTLKVGEEELQAHQDVLRARSPVFESMLKHDTTEKNSGVIDIPDCNPEAMKLFLLYVYCGKVESLDQTNMLALYYIADKYDMPGLKKKCCDFIKKSLSHTNICDVIQLALTHSNTSLLEHATEYFMDNVTDIMVTVEWQSFLKDNSILGNELLLKSFWKIKDSKK